MILYSLNERSRRNTINENLNSFRKYSTRCSFHYINVFNQIPSFLFGIKYDAVILHYTFLAEKRFLADGSPWEQKIRGLEHIKGYKIAIPQDEYDYTDRLCSLYKNAGIGTVYTCFTRDKDIAKAYPVDKTGILKIEKVFTGYIDEAKIELLAKKSQPFSVRAIDIGYRGRKLPAYLGKHGQLKFELVRIFNNAINGKGLVVDIKNTNENFLVEDQKAIKLGFSWYDFLLSCKAFIGCEGGSSLLDNDGSIQKKIKEYLFDHKDATFEEIELNCFPELDYNIQCFALSPRHFEAAMTRTLQILVEGEYGNVFIPWKHYLPLKRDFSNIEEILGYISNETECSRIIENAYRDIVESSQYTYRTFVTRIIDETAECTGNSLGNFPLFKLYGLLMRQRNTAILFISLANRKIKYLWKQITVRLI